MPKSIKRVAHDLMPLSDAATELSAIISQLLDAIKPYVETDSMKVNQYFAECTEATKKLALSTRLIKEYIQNLNADTDKASL